MKVYVRLLYFFEGLFKITGEPTEPFSSSLSTQLLLGTDADVWTRPRADCSTSQSPPGLVFSLSLGNQPQPLRLLNLCGELALHREQEIILTSSFSVGTLCKNHHAWAHVPCFLPCKSYMLFLVVGEPPTSSTQ